MIERISEIIELNSERWFGRFIAKSEIQYFYTSANSVPHGKLILFFFKKRENMPIVVVKMVRNHKYSYSLRTEYENLQKIRELKWKIQGIPEPYYYGEIIKTSFLIEPYLPGIPLHSEFNKIFVTKKYNEKAEELFAKIFSWIRNFHILTAKTILAGEFFKGYEFTNTYGSSTITVGTIQGDYWTGNILLDGSEIKVIDWEWSEQDSPLVWDIFFFALSFIRQLTWAIQYKNDNSNLFFILKNNNHWAIVLLNNFINNYLKEFDIDKVMELYLLNKFLIQLSHREQKRYGYLTGEDKYWYRIYNEFISIRNFDPLR